MKATLKKNDKLANIVIISLSIVVFALVVLMRKVKLDIDFGFDTHIFPKISATLNSIVAILLVVGLYIMNMNLIEGLKLSGKQLAAGGKSNATKNSVQKAKKL